MAKVTTIRIVPTIPTYLAPAGQHNATVHQQQSVELLADLPHPLTLGQNPLIRFYPLTPIRMSYPLSGRVFRCQFTDRRSGKPLRIPTGNADNGRFALRTRPETTEPDHADADLSYSREIRPIRGPL